MKSLISKKKSENFDKWYQEVCLKSELVSRGAIKGQIILRPYGLKIWKLIQKFLDKRFKELNCEEIKFPTLIPYSEIKKEKKHLEGFNPELGIIEKKGNKILNDPFVLRPTSEILFTKYFSDILKSYKDLPILLNQWGSVVRWEKNTKIFLRNNEFWWQEGHTIHESSSEAQNLCLKILNIYNELISNFLLIKCVMGEKSKSERFAGAERTWTLETILPDGQALQCATTHFLDKNFSKPFFVKYQTKDNKMENPYQTSWGISTRIMGAIVMLHSDDFGLVLPTNIAPYQVVVLTNENIYNEIKGILSNLRVKYDIRDIDNIKKNVEWKTKGVPIIIEVNENDFNKKQFFVKSRTSDVKRTINFSEVNIKIKQIIDEHDDYLLNNSVKLLENKIKNVDNFNDFKKYLNKGYLLKASFSLNEEDEKEIKQTTGATIRCIIDEKPLSKCFYGGSEINSQAVVIFGRSY